MPQPVTQVDLLQDYIKGVIDRAEHHANNVDEVCLAIAGAVIWRKDGPLEVMVQQGDMKNVLWLRVNGRRSAMSYNHDLGQIEVREGTTRGQVLAAFTNATPLADVKRYFGGL